MSVLDNMIDDYLNHGISCDDEQDYDYDYKEDNNEKLDRYYSRTYNQQRYEDEMNLFR